MYDENLLKLAIETAVKNIKKNGGPFGAVISFIDEEGTPQIAVAGNRVTQNNDPTAHAEIMAIRKACSLKGSFSLEDAVLYSSCEPCPMCLAAAHWAGIREIYYFHTQKQAADIGFDDAFLYKQLALPAEKRTEGMRPIYKKVSIKEDPFYIWEKKEDKEVY